MDGDGEITCTLFWMCGTMVEANIQGVGGFALRTSPLHTCKYPFSLNIAVG
jgi:hypothetical protein